MLVKFINDTPVLPADTRKKWANDPVYGEDWRTELQKFEEALATFGKSFEDKVPGVGVEATGLPDEWTHSLRPTSSLGRLSWRCKKRWMV